jgi:NAD(P)-dependent dehydrogenase (short-subunit alcohol dehydrogenase family)
MAWDDLSKRIAVDQVVWCKGAPQERNNQMANWFVGKVALVTGAGSGIGRASAQKFAELGAKVIVADIVAEGGNETVRLIREAGGEATFIKTDVSQAKEVEALVSGTVETYGRLDCAHNNAGIEGSQAPIADSSEADFDRVISINLKGVWLCMKYEVMQMLKQGGGGAIVNTSSVAGLVGFAGITPYTASKHGVAGLTKAVALEYATAGIRVNAVCPGVIDTPMIERFASDLQVRAQLLAQEPVNRLGTPQEVANAVAWLCSDEASFMTGVPMPVDGGWVAL